MEEPGKADVCIAHGEQIKELQMFNKLALEPRLIKLDEMHEMLQTQSAIVDRHEKELTNSIERRKENRKMAKERVFYIVGALILMLLASASSKIMAAVIHVLSR